MITDHFGLEMPHIHPPAYSRVISEISWGCSRLCPVTSSRTETMQPLWTTCFTAYFLFGKKWFLISTLKLCSFNLCLLSHILLLCTTVKSLAPSTPWHPHRCWGAAVIFPEASQSWSLSLSSQGKSSSPSHPGDSSGPFPQNYSQTGGLQPVALKGVCACQG